MVTTALGLNVPAGTDPFDPQVDIGDLATSLEGRVIVPVANVAARTALVAAVTPSVAEPLYVFRADAPAGLQLEMTTDGTAWAAMTQGPFMPYAATLVGFSPGTAGGAVNRTEWRREGMLVRVRYQFVFGTNGTIPGAGGVTVSVPVPADPAEPYLAIGTGLVTRPPTSYFSVPRLETTGVFRITIGTAPLNNITGTSPWGGAWAPLDSLTGSLTYLAAP